MPVEFGSDEWVKCLKDEVNKSKAYRDAAKNWEGDFYFVIHGIDGSAQAGLLYLDLWHGQCREAYRVTGPLGKSPEFTIEAPLATWRRVLERKLDPIQGLIMRQLKLKGNLFKIMGVPRAAVELVKCCTRIPTAWPVV